jgi:parallel beta-helix repeat protein
MTKEAFLALMLISLALLITIPLSKAEYLPNPPLPTIFIKEDGSIEPSTALILRNGNTYILTDNITNYELIIQCDNIIVDGRGFTIKARDSAIFLLNAPKYTDFRQNVTITNFVIQDSYYGIGGIYSNCTIKGNTINCYNAIDVSSHCSNNQIVGNTLIGSSQGNGHGIGVAGSSNVISGNRIAKFYRSIWLDRGDNNTVTNNILSNTTSNIIIDD